MGHGVAVLLLTTLAGYVVLERAENHKGELRRMGRFLGSIVIVVSLVGVVCNIFALMGCPSGMCPTGMGKGMGKRGSWCPFSHKAMP
jgi:hypothetical protein